MTKSTTCNGWSNYETWSAAASIANDEFMYSVSVLCRSYEQFAETMREHGIETTLDGIAWDDESVNADELNETWGE